MTSKNVPSRNVGLLSCASHKKLWKDFLGKEEEEHEYNES